jgi:hypothetical protein
MNYEEKILIWKSKLLSEDVLSEDICNSLTQKIIDVESEIMKLGPSNYDKVPENTITAKHLYYNLLSYKWDELETLKNKIVINSSKIIGGDSFLVKMWANSFKKGEYIKKHIHHAEPIIETEDFRKNIFNTICGHLFLENDVASETIYYFDNNIVPMQSRKGNMHFFSCIVPHEVPPYRGDKRISIAFDVYRVDFFEKLGIPTPTDLIIIK